MDLLIRELAKRALAEDIGSGDLTTDYTVNPEAKGSGEIIAREEGIIAGLPVAAEVFRCLDSRLRFKALVEEGQRVENGRTLALIKGRLQPMLTAERTALNFVQRLSGIATRAAAWVKQIEGYRARLADTRKTTPGLRLLEKYAVRVGGASNHRLALDGGILIKENHIRAAGSIARAVQLAMAKAPFMLAVEVEVTTLAELEEALQAGAKIIMLDNMDLETIKKAVAIAGGRALLEASGNITFDRLREVAETGVDLISCGALTHSCQSLDISLLVRSEK